MITSAIKKQTSICCSISLNHGGKKEKRKAILLLTYIADVSCLTNRPFYIQTLLSSKVVCLFSIRSYQ